VDIFLKNLYERQKKETQKNMIIGENLNEFLFGNLYLARVQVTAFYRQKEAGLQNFQSSNELIGKIQK
jgi:hypothetical protein